jgi:hypothetical protein
VHNSTRAHKLALDGKWKTKQFSYIMRLDG